MDELGERFLGDVGGRGIKIGGGGGGEGGIFSLGSGGHIVDGSGILRFSVRVVKVEFFTFWRLRRA